MGRMKSYPVVASIVGVLILTHAAGVVAQTEDPDWRTVSDVPGLARLDGSATLASDATGAAVLVGFSAGKKPEALAWFSSDAEAWSQVELPGSKASQAFSVVAGPAGYVAVGRGRDGGRIWHSPSGEAWSDVGAGLAPSGGIYDVSATPDGYTAVGFVNKGKGRKARSIPTAWSSADAISWAASPISDVAGAAFDIATADDGRHVGTLFQPERAGPKKGRTFDILPPSLSIVSSTDGSAWLTAPGDPFVGDLRYLEAWDLDEAAGRFFFRADTVPSSLAGTPDGFLTSEDGAAWQPASGLLGIDGAVGPLGAGAVAMGDGTVLLSDDGTTWRSSYEDALSGAQVTSLTSLPDGRVLAVGAAGKPGQGSTLYLGTPSADGPPPSTDCLDPAVRSELDDSGTDLFELPAPEREQIAAAMAALQLPDEATSLARDRVVRDLRQGGTEDPLALIRIQAGEITLPVCE